MNARHDGSSIDLERALVRYMAERRISRRYLLERIALLGAAAALAPSSPPARAHDRAAVRAAASAAATAPPAGPPIGRRVRRPRRPSPTPVPAARGGAVRLQLDATTWARRHPSFEEKYGVKVTYDFFDDYDTMLRQDRPGRRRLRHHVSRVDRHPGAPPATDVIQPLDQSLIPNIVNLGAEWANPGYDPGNAHSVPYMWWTTGVAYDTAKVTDELTSWTALWDARTRSTSRCSTTSARRSPRRCSGWASPRTRRTTPSWTGPRSCSRSRSRWSGSTRRTTSASCPAATPGSAHAWGSDVYQITHGAADGQVLHPGGGRRPRLRHDGHTPATPSTRSRRTCSSTTCSTRR